MNYGERIALLRDHKQLTQQELANIVGITRAALSHYENNRRKPDYQVIRNIADYFQVSVDYLIGRTNQLDE